MKRRAFVGSALAGVSVTGAYAAPPKAKAGDIPTTTFGKTGVKVSVIAQGGAAFLKAYDRWDTVMMPVHAADRAYLSFEETALPVAIERGVGIQAIKVFGKASLLRSLRPIECLRYALSQTGVHVAICGAGTQGQMEDNIRAVQSLRKMTPEEIADVRKRAGVGAGVYTGSTMEYWKKKA